MTNSELLIAAKRLLEDQGWCKWHVLNAESQHCALGAILEAFGGRNAIMERPFIPAMDILAEAIPAKDQPFWMIEDGEVKKDPWGVRIAGYNNTRKDYAEIAAWFDRAIELAQAKEMYAELAKPSSEVTMTLSQATDQEAQSVELTTATSV